jgi:N6-L-threonylcarbamoyladenine synthase
MGTDGELVANIKRPLPVKPGERGLRQSDAVFAHIKNIPSAMAEARSYLEGATVVAVGVSERPRNVDGSYMPCFLSGVAAAESVAATNGVPLYKFSHQCGHIMAALYSSGRTDLLEKEFCAFHVSGGTTEVLRVNKSGAAFSAELVGGTADINAGQLIDRVGVHMGLPFPAGAHMEKLALENETKLPSIRVKINDRKVNLSGAENQAIDLFKKTDDPRLTSAYVLNYVTKALSLLAATYEEDFGKTEFVFAGGVMSNSIIKAALAKQFNASFATPACSADNAVGIACLAMRAYISENK